MTTLPAGKNISALHVLKVIVFTGIILYAGRTLFIPLSFALLISFILYPFCKMLEKFSFSRGSAILLSLFLLTLLFVLLGFVFFQQIRSFSEMWPELEVKLTELMVRLRLYFFEKYGVSIDTQEKFINKTSGDFGSWLLSYAGTTIYSLGVALVMFVLIPIMSALILYYRKVYIYALASLFPGETKASLLELVQNVVHNYFNFIKGMALVYLIVGILNSTGLFFLGIPHPILFGFIASLLTFIPYAGILIASLLPVTIAWLTFNSLWYPVGVIGIFAFVQYLEANIIFPFAVSNKLNLNMLATIIAIIAGGILWGASGMILFVPYLSILKLIADKSARLDALAKVLGTETS